MKVSYKWLKEYLDFDLQPENLAHILTDTGLEVEGVHEFRAGRNDFSQVRVGEVKEVVQHPNADRLKVTKVDVGTGILLNIVCGAPNVAKGQKVIVACVGAVLHTTSGEEIAIRKSKIRGEVSEGMICAEDELGIGASHDGIMVLPQNTKTGTPAAEYFNLYQDWVLEIGLTPNRSDAMSHFGVARDLAARLNLEKPTKALPPQVDLAFRQSETPEVTVSVADPSACGRYAGVTLHNVSVGESPAWLQNRLKSIGLQPKNSVVDVTNFVMHELGQPLHAFDLSKINGKKIFVKNATAGSEFITLDGVARKLDARDLTISDETKVLALAGVMGGQSSMVDSNTTSVFLECAWFDPVVVRKTAKRHSINSDASYRFERGVDPAGTIFALKRAVNLITELTGADAETEYLDFTGTLPQPAIVPFHLPSAFQLIGEEIPVEVLKRIFDSLDIVIQGERDSVLTLQIPVYRTDVSRQVDVVEEILRIYGYNRIAIPQKMQSSLAAGIKPNNEKLTAIVADYLAARGFLEMMANGLTRSSYAEMFFGETGKNRCVSILNPLSQELDAMRQTLLGSALEVVAYNQNRQLHDLKFFELGRCYTRNEKQEFEEFKAMSVTLSGNVNAENWNRKEEPVRFSDLAAEVESVLSRIGILNKLKRSASTTVYFSESLAFEIKGKTLVEFGWVTEAILEKFDIKSPVLFAQFNWTECLVLAGRHKVILNPLPKFPSVRRDLSLLLDESVTFAQIEEVAERSGGKFLTQVGLFDVYHGKNLPSGKKSYAVNFILQNKEATLTDKVIDATMNKIRASLEEKLGATLRG